MKYLIVFFADRWRVYMQKKDLFRMLTVGCMRVPVFGGASGSHRHNLPLRQR